MARMSAAAPSSAATATTIRWPASGVDGEARAAALESLRARTPTPAALVTYRAANSLLLVVDSRAEAEPLLDLLPAAALQVTILVADPDKPRISLAQLGGFELVHARVAHFEGHLGRFVVRVAEDDAARNLARSAGHAREDFDLVLDLGARPLAGAVMAPPGYRAPRSESELDEVLAELPQLVGEFAKPDYLQYNTDICAHGASGIGGCTRCIDACPTSAIRSLGERVELDPYLCQGGGVCATVCPTGAITYQYPRVSELLENLRRALRRYYDGGGRGPWLLILDDEQGSAAAAGASERIPENVIPLFVEEIGSLGMEAWLTALCYGAHGVSIACSEAPMTGEIREQLAQQLRIANKLLDALGLPADRLRLLDIAAPREWWRELPAGDSEALVPATGFAVMEEKRTVLQLALDHLYAHAPRQPQRVDLPWGAPFGEVLVDRDRCTLCMACVSVCPASALHDGEELPMLRFIERNCVQCGICQSACPENAIDLRPVYTFDRDRRATMQVLNEEPPFPCVRCGKPFTTMTMMQTMRDKLAGHWMFQDAEQQARLEMCATCRVADMFANGDGLDPYRKDVARDDPGR